MANKGIVNGAEPHGVVKEMNVYKAESTIMPGDFVSQNANGTVAPSAATSAIMGVAISYAAAGADCLVADHPDQLFHITADGTNPSAQTDIGLNYDITPGSASATYRRSGMQLASASGATTSTLPLKLIAISRDVDNALGANAKCVVRINNHQHASAGTAGV